MLRSTAAMRSNFQFFVVFVMWASMAAACSWAPRARRSAISFVASVLLRTFQKSDDTRLMGSFVCSHWYSIWNAHSRAFVRRPISSSAPRAAHGAQQRHHGHGGVRRLRALVVGPGNAARPGLLLVLHGQDAEGHRHPGVEPGAQDA